MNARQKIVLALLECFGGTLKSLEMQKYLFLFCQNQTHPSYHFLPYKYGCFSFQAYHDKRKLIEQGILEDTDQWSLTRGATGFFDSMPISFKQYMRSFKNNFGRLTYNELIAYVYKHFPYYAINSEIADRYLTDEELGRIKAAKPHNSNRVLYTAGYEGKSLEEFLNMLIHQDIRLVCDVRKNPISRKYGFSKSTLLKAAETIGIEYKHFPELGIESSKRANLTSQSDYDRLFAEYKKDVLHHNEEALEELVHLTETHARIVLICFEKNSRNCHRSEIAQAVKSLNSFKAKVIPL